MFSRGPPIVLTGEQGCLGGLQRTGGGGSVEKGGVCGEKVENSEKWERRKAFQETGSGFRGDFKLEYDSASAVPSLTSSEEKGWLL